MNRRNGGGMTALSKHAVKGCGGKKEKCKFAETLKRAVDV